MSCYNHNCLGLSLWSYQSTGLKITSQKESHQLCHLISSVEDHQHGRWSGYCLFYRGVREGRKCRAEEGETCKPRQETHCRPGTFFASGPHSHGNNIHLLTCTGTHPRHTRKHNTSLPWPSWGIRSCMQKIISLCWIQACRPLLPGAGWSESEIAAYCDIEADTSIEESRWSVACSSGTMGISHICMDSSRGENGGFLVFHFTELSKVSLWVVA